MSLISDTTFGTSARVDEAWPAALGRASNMSVCNMGLGTYGASHSALNISAALDLSPEFVDFALYFGNDYYDDFRFALAHDRLSTLISGETAGAVVALEGERLLADEIIPRAVVRHIEPATR